MFLFKEYQATESQLILKNYGNNIYRLIYLNKVKKSGFEKFTKEQSVHYEKINGSFESSIVRTKSHIKELVLCNDFDFFATWTINEDLQDRFSLDKVVENMKKDLKAYQRKFKDFKYLYIIEKHENGAFHFHGFVKGIPESELILYTDNDYDLSKGNKLPYKLIEQIKKGEKIYHIKFFDDRKGHNTFSRVKSKIGSSFYILKYITKNPIRTSENQIYFRSRGLKMAISERLDFNDDIVRLINEKGFTNSFGSFYDFNFEDLDEKIKLDLILN